MPSQSFQFKQFSIEQDQCAMKVGTDGVLLGAWAANATAPQNILDVGTGTGLIALMMAQRFPDANIHAIEIEPAASKQAQQNFSNSGFPNTPRPHHGDFFEWNAPVLFDLIVCNPPFYPHAFPASSAERETARHGKHFNILTFMIRAAQLLTPAGRLAIIVPFDLGEELMGSTTHMYLSRKCAVLPTPHKNAHRYLLEWSMSPTTLLKTKLTIEDAGRHQYSIDYVNLTKDFYLKF